MKVALYTLLFEFKVTLLHLSLECIAVLRSKSLTYSFYYIDKMLINQLFAIITLSLYLLSPKTKKLMLDPRKFREWSMQWT